MYMIREVFRAQRGTAPALIAGLKTINQALLTQAGFSHGKMGLDHGVGHPASCSLSHCASRWTEGCRRNID